MPISLTCRGTPDRIEWRHTRNSPVEFVLYSDVSGNPGTGKHPERMQDAVQARFDLRTALADLSSDEEWLTSIPESLENIVWKGDAGGKKIALATHMIVRSIIVTVDSWDGEKYNCSTARVRPG